MKLGKKILSSLLVLVMVIGLIPGFAFTSLAEETVQPIDYRLVLYVSGGVGKAYKNSVSDSNEIDLPAGLSYTDGTWTMDGFVFSTTADYAVHFPQSAKVSLAPGSVNRVTTSNNSEYYVLGIYSEGTLDFCGSGSLEVKAGTENAGGDSSGYVYGIYAYDMNMYGGNVTVTAEYGNYVYGAYIYDDLYMYGGKLTAKTANAGYGSYAIFCYDDFWSENGVLNAEAEGEEATGLFAYYLYIPFGGEVNASSISYRYIESEGGSSAMIKSDYMSHTDVADIQKYGAYGLNMPINVKGYYNNNWIKTTYADQGYNVSTSGLGKAKLIPNAEFVYGGHYVLLSYKVTAVEAVSDGRIGIWTDVQIGDNDYAPIHVVKDEDSGDVVGFELVDDHTDYCSNLNAKYMCYFDGYMISSAIDGKDFEPAATYWFGNYGGADDNVFNNIAGNECYGYIKDEISGQVIGLSGIDSGMAVSWNVNLEAGESKTYYALLGIGDATFKEKPKFTEESVPSVTADGKVNATVTNKIENKEDAGNLTLSVITTEGKELTVGDAPLELLTEQDTAPYDMTAVFTDRLINARPGGYSVKTVRATNKGGMFTDYTFDDASAPSTVVSLIPREGGLDLEDTPTGFQSLLYEGWEWDKDNNKLSFFGLDLTGEEGIKLPAGVKVAVEEEGVKINVNGENRPAISSRGSMTIENQPDSEGGFIISAPIGIKADGNVTINTNVELDASATAIQVGENGALNIENGANLVINLTSEDAVMFKSGENVGIRVNIPEGYRVEGGTIDNNGFLVLDPGVTTLKIIDAGEYLVTYDYNGHGSVDVATLSVAKKSYLERPEDPTAFGWAFQGWMTEAGEAWNFLTGRVMNKMTLTAKWKAVETSEKTIGEKTIDTGVAAMKASTGLVPEKQQEKEIVDEIMANKSASTVPSSLRAAIRNETYEAIAQDMENGQNLILGLNVDLVGCELVEETATANTVTIRYDVHPWYCIKTDEEDEGTRYPISNEELNGKPITFRLPLTKVAKGFTYVKLRHYLESGEEDLIYLPICSTSENGKEEFFITVSADQFSIFEMNFTNEKDEEEHVTPRNDEEEHNWWTFEDTGWKLHNGSWYNIQDNRLVKGWYYEEEDDNWYYMDPDTGIMKTGWIKLHDNWFFLNPENDRQSWFIGEDGKYHFGGDENSRPLGALYTGCTTPDGYEVDETGMMIEFEEL